MCLHGVLFKKMLMIHFPFGKYTAGSSTLHRLDPRAKLLGTALLVCSAVLTDSWTGLFILSGTVVFAMLCAKMQVKEAVRDLWSLKFLFLFTLLLHILLGGGDAGFRMPLGMRISLHGLEKGLFFSVKIGLMILLLGPVMRTTHPSAWTKALERNRNHRGTAGRMLAGFALSLGLAIRFLPMLLAEAERIRWAQIGRGLKTGGNPVERARSFIPLLAPLIGSSFHRAELITNAMHTRGFQLDRPRSIYRIQKFGIKELLTIIITISASTVAMIV